MTTSKNVKNEELQLTFKKQLDTCIPFCFHVQHAQNEDGTPKLDKNNQEYYSVFVAQKIMTESGQSLDAMMNGWEASKIVRSIKRLVKDVADKNQVMKNLMTVGKLHTTGKTNEEIYQLMAENKDVSNEKFTNIQITHTFEKPYDNKEPRKVFVKAEQLWYLLTKNGNLTYEHTDLVLAKDSKNTIFTDVDKTLESDYQMNTADTI
jgi:hypothetical protein